VLPVQSFVRLPPDPGSVRDARRQVRETLTRAGQEEWADDAVLAVSEVVTNVVLHARTDCELTVLVSADGVRVNVRDFSPSLPAQRHFPRDATTGRGLGLVVKVTADFGIDVLDGDGKVVWFVVDGESAGTAAAAAVVEWDLTELLPRSEPDARDGAAMLLHVPMALWLAALEHQAAVLRELYLVRASARSAGEAVHAGSEGGWNPTALAAAADLTGGDAALRALSEATDRALEAAASQPSLPRLHPLPPGHPSALPEVPASLDLQVPFTAVDSAALSAFQDALDQGQRLAREGLLLVRPALDELVALRDWACDQVVAQATGVLPAPWDQSGSHAAIEDADYSRPVWDDVGVRTSARAVVAADDSNRLIAISPAAAELLGGTAEDLVGRRITTIIPHRLRDQHVAGFTRHLTTGEARVLGVELDLPVLRLDGQEVVRRFLIEQVITPGGRRVYVAWLDPVPTSPDQR
jgi:PAS domain S-box-containing protein